MKKHPSSRSQRGGFVIGLVVGLLMGLAIALGVALYVTKAPNPFVNKVPARSAGQDAAEIERNRNWDPNSALAGRNPAVAASAPTATAPAVTAPIAPDPGRPVAVAPPLPTASAPASAPRVARPGTGASAAVATAPRASQAVSTTGSSPFTYFVQAGAFARSEDAEQQRARLAMLGVESRLTEREQAGRTVYRVRVGPFERREEAESAKEKLGDSGVDATLVAVQR
ncbi:MAG TPA: SPOR domain-containing protein [Caldimonas sp.]|jgi:cell division protein FtsN|nr:SPOR domain-containing protein [Caldimonas sp.]HEX2540921.1 SPOR domain-containing protein [Caldimonas sp.]